ncbi:MAG: nucleotidyl transferase AbiEii/AbiGii toxin family protein [Bacteroidota bacterium]
MSGKKNLPASVRQRLLNLSRQEGRSFNEILQYYAMERFLYRLSQSAHARTFVLKGAMMLRVWGVTGLRPTMDIDLLGRTRNVENAVLSQLLEVLGTQVEPDGLVFDAETLHDFRNRKLTPQNPKR